MHLHKIHFSLEEAFAALEDAKEDAQKIRDFKKKLDEWGYDIYRHEYLGGTGPNGRQYHPPELERMVHILKSLEARGIVVKAIDDVLLDFPHLRENGEEVYLCWKWGEEALLYWHGISDGFPGRRPLKEL